MCLKEIEYKGKKYKVKYIHDRRIKEIDVGYGFTIERILPKGGVTVAFITDYDGKPIESGYAECSIKDSYNKKLGRTIATGRLLKKLGLNTKLALE